MDNTWLTQAKRLQAIASTGLHFCRDEYRERYAGDRRHRPSHARRAGGVPPARIRSWSPISPRATPRRRWTYAARSSSMTDPAGAREKRRPLDAAGRLCRRRPVASRERDQGNPRRSGHRRVRHAPVQRAPQGQARIRARRAGFLQAVLPVRARDGDERTPTPGLETMDADFFAPDRLPPLSAAWWKAISRRHSRSGPTKQERRRSTKTDMRQCAPSGSRRKTLYPVGPSSELHSAVLMDAPARPKGPRLQRLAARAAGVALMLAAASTQPPLTPTMPGY